MSSNIHEWPLNVKGEYTTYTEYEDVIKFLTERLPTQRAAILTLEDVLSSFTENATSVFLGWKVVDEVWGTRLDGVGMSIIKDDPTDTQVCAFRVDAGHTEVATQQCRFRIFTGAQIDARETIEKDNGSDFFEVSSNLAKAIDALTQDCSCRSCQTAEQGTSNEKKHLLTMTLAHYHPLFGNPRKWSRSPDGTVGSYTSPLDCLTHFKASAFNDGLLSFKDMRSHIWSVLSGAQWLDQVDSDSCTSAHSAIPTVCSIYDAGDHHYYMLTKRRLSPGPSKSWSDVACARIRPSGESQGMVVLPMPGNNIPQNIMEQMEYRAAVVLSELENLGL